MAAALPDNLTLLPLEAIIDKPVLSREGRHLLIDRGYHRAEGIFLDWDGTGELPPVEECVKRLDELFGVYAEDPRARPGFPFDSPASRAHLYACLLAGVIGPAVPKKPFFLFDKATPRTGATLMAGNRFRHPDRGSANLRRRGRQGHCHCGRDGKGPDRRRRQ